MLKNRSQLNIHCKDCTVNKLCLPSNLELNVVQELNTIIERVKLVSKSEHIYYAGDKVTNIYAVFSGSCKEAHIDENGNESINNFFFPGDLIGLESIPDRKYLFSASALENTQICVIPLDSLLKLMSQHNTLLKRFIDVASYKMQNDHQIRTTTNANKRIADFILNIFHRLQERNIQHDELELPMSQLDISNFLGMAHETVNRLLRSMHNQHIIQFKNKRISKINIPKLQELSTPSST